MRCLIAGVAPARSAHDTSPRRLTGARPSYGRRIRHQCRQTSPPTVAPSLVSTWTLTTFEQGVSGGPAARVPNPRGLLVLDAAGHAFEFVTSSVTQRIAGGQVPVADAPAAFGAYGGSGSSTCRSGAEDHHLIAPKAAFTRRLAARSLAILLARGEPADDHVRR